LREAGGEPGIKSGVPGIPHFLFLSARRCSMRSKIFVPNKINEPNKAKLAAVPTVKTIPTINQIQIGVKDHQYKLNPVEINPDTINTEYIVRFTTLGFSISKLV
jgi:hypothetical protein